MRDKMRRPFHVFILAGTLFLFSFSPTALFANDGEAANGGLSGGEVASLALWFLVAASGAVRQRIRSDEDKHLALDASSAKTREIPYAFPITGFRPSRKQLKEYVGWWGILTGTGGIAGSVFDALNVGWWDIGDPDKFTDGGMGGGAIAAAGFFVFFAIRKFAPHRCPYCRYFHNPTRKVCPRTELPLWLSAQFLDRNRGIAISDTRAVGELIALNYYPYIYPLALKVAPIAWELILAPDKVPPLPLSEVEESLVSHPHVKAVILTAQVVGREPSDVLERLSELLAQRGYSDAQVTGALKRVHDNTEELYQALFRLIYVKPAVLREALQQIRSMHTAKLEDEIPLIERMEQVVKLAND